MKTFSTVHTVLDKMLDLVKGLCNYYI